MATQIWFSGGLFTKVSLSGLTSVIKGLFSFRGSCIVVASLLVGCSSLRHLLLL